MRLDLWSCRVGALAVGAVAGGLYTLRHEQWPTEPGTDCVALAVTIGVGVWLLGALRVARRRDAVRARVRPGIALGAVAGVTLAVAANVRGWPVTVGDAAVVLGTGMVGSAGVLGVPGSLRENPWVAARRESERE